jgi:hypothetical protein
MHKRKPDNLFARVVCANAPYVITAALCIAGLLSPLALAAFLPGLWSLAGLTAVVVIAGLAALGQRSRGEFLLESRLGLREPEIVNGPASRSSVPENLSSRPGGWSILIQVVFWIDIGAKAVHTHTTTRSLRLLTQPWVPHPSGFEGCAASHETSSRTPLRSRPPPLHRDPLP